MLYVDVVEAAREDVRYRVRARGTVTPRMETTLVSEVSGQVVDRAPELVAGGFFRRDDVLLTIDPRNYRAELKRAEAAVARARTQVARQVVVAGYPAEQFKRFREGRIDGEEARALALEKPQLAEALAELESAEAQLEQARGDLERTRIRAPYDGMVRTKRAELGQFVAAGTPLADVFAVDYAELRLPIAQSDLPYLELPGARPAPESGPRVALHARVGTERHTWQGRIVRTEGVFEASTQVLYAVARVADPYGLQAAREEPLRIGTFVEAEIEGRLARDVIRLPRHVLQPGGVVWVIDDDATVRKREVEVLRADERWVYIGTGLADGARVSVTPVANPLPGTPARVLSSQPATATEPGGRG